MMTAVTCQVILMRRIGLTKYKIVVFCLILHCYIILFFGTHFFVIISMYASMSSQHPSDRIHVSVYSNNFFTIFIYFRSFDSILYTKLRSWWNLNNKLTFLKHYVKSIFDYSVALIYIYTYMRILFVIYW